MRTLFPFRLNAEARLCHLEVLDIDRQVTEKSNKLQSEEEQIRKEKADKRNGEKPEESRRENPERDDGPSTIEMLTSPKDLDREVNSRREALTKDAEGGSQFVQKRLEGAKQDTRALKAKAKQETRAAITAAREQQAEVRSANEKSKMINEIADTALGSKPTEVHEVTTEQVDAQRAALRNAGDAAESDAKQQVAKAETQPERNATEGAGNERGREA